MNQLYGIDVSHYQSPVAPGGIPWSLLKQSGCSFAMVRGTYGTSRDEKAVAHVNAARAVGIDVTLYHFLRIAQPITDQIAAFNAQALACGLRVGDIAPAVDIEDDGPTGPKVDPSWSDAAQVFVLGMVAMYGEALIYDTQRDFGRMGKPAWMLERPHWVAHYTGAPKPATPSGIDWTIWQHRVGPWAMNGEGGAFSADGKRCFPGGPPPGPLDQSRAKRLPRITRVPGATGSLPPPPNGPAPDHSHAELVTSRLDALTSSALAGLDLGHDQETSDAYNEATS
jgi:hypothetical protein